MDDNFIKLLIKLTQNSIFLLIGTAIIYSIVVIILKKRAPQETLCNIGVYAGYFLVKKYLTAAFTLGAFSMAFSARLWDIPNSLGSLIACVVVVDFLYYWKHRLEHRVRLLWMAHSPHHSSTEFNLSTALRLPWISPLYAWLAYLPACLLGFHPLVVLLSSAVVLGYQFLIHTEVIGTLPWLDMILNTPSNHRVHHASNRHYLDKNYAGIFMLWDHLFGTFKAETVRPRYGITKPINTINPLLVNTLEIERCFNDAKAQKTASSLIKTLLGPPK